LPVPFTQAFIDKFSSEFDESIHSVYKVDRPLSDHRNFIDESLDGLLHFPIAWPLAY
jgi:hypothetical protein